MTCNVCGAILVLNERIFELYNLGKKTDEIAKEITALDPDTPLCCRNIYLTAITYSDKENTFILLPPSLHTHYASKYIIKDARLDIQSERP